MAVPYKRLLTLLLAISLLLLIPLIAMQFTSEVNWSVMDFVAMGILLLGAGLLGELVFRKIKRPSRRKVFYFIIILVFLLLWAELGVGIFGTPFAGD